MDWERMCEGEWMGECMCVEHDRGVSAGMKDVGKKEKTQKFLCYVNVFVFVFCFCWKKKTEIQTDRHTHRCTNRGKKIQP